MGEVDVTRLNLVTKTVLMGGQKIFEAHLLRDPPPPQNHLIQPKKPRAKTGSNRTTRTSKNNFVVNHSGILLKHRFTQLYSDNDESIEFDLDLSKLVESPQVPDVTAATTTEQLMSVPQELRSSTESSPITGSDHDPFLLLIVRVTLTIIIKKSKFLEYHLEANGVPLCSTIDTAAETSCITLDLDTKTNMNTTNKEIPIYLANHSVIFSPGLATGHLTFAFDGPAKNVHIKASKPILPVKDQLLIGCDLLSTLGLMNDSGVYIRTDEEHRKFLVAEALFDSLIIRVPEVFATNVPNPDTTPLSRFKQILKQKRTRIELPESEAKELFATLHNFADM
ncbi:hypothetical protein GEMRC1_009857 [Eukaryota sp. GEM-RC1]